MKYRVSPKNFLSCLMDDQYSFFMCNVFNLLLVIPDSLKGYSWRKLHFRFDIYIYLPERT